MNENEERRLEERIRERAYKIWLDEVSLKDATKNIGN